MQVLHQILGDYMRKQIISVLVLISFTLVLPAFDITFEKKIRLSEKTLLQRPTCLCITEDGLFLVNDLYAGDIKIYQPDGKLVNVIGSKGFGPNEFANPFFSCYNDKRLIVFDFGQSKLFYYDRIDDVNFNRTNAITFLDGVDDFILRENNLYISAERTRGKLEGRDGNIDSLFSFNLDNPKEISYYLPTYKKFGFASQGQLKNEFFGKQELMALGQQAFFTIEGDYAYLCWQADLKVFKINLRTKDITTFGEKTANHVKPRASQKLIDALFTRQIDTIKKLKGQGSYVRKVFANQKHVMILYNPPDKNNQDRQHIVQAYTHDGKFITEKFLPGGFGLASTFNKKNNKFYAISSETGNDDDEWFTVTMYNIID